MTLYQKSPGDPDRSAVTPAGVPQEAPRAELRDLGFRPYVGARHAPSHNGWVLFRYGLRRAWSSTILKLCALAGFGPALVALVAFAIFGYLAAQNPGQMPAPDLALYARRLSSVQLWLFVTAAAVGVGTGVIAEDRARMALPFYFAKPVTPRQYLLGRAGAVFVVLLLVHALPCSLFVTMGLGLQQDAIWVALRALGACWATALLSAAAVTALSLALSSTVTSPTLAAFAFVAFWLVPHVGGLLVDIAADSPWLALSSVPGLLDSVTSPLFAASEDITLVQTLTALFALAALTVGGLFFTHARLVAASRMT